MQSNEISFYKNYALTIATMCVALMFLLYSSAASGSGMREPAFFAAIGFALIALVVLVIQKGNIQRERRLSDLRASLAHDELRAQRVTELYLSADYHRRQASLNGLAAIAVLIFLAVFVGLAGQFINQDSVTFKSVEGLSDQIKTARSYPADKSVVDALLAQYTETVREQTKAEAAMVQPIYRMISTFLIRASVIAVGIYLVVLTNRAFKYNNSLAALYRARLIATLRGDGEVKDFEAYTATLELPVSHVYDSEVDHPLEKISAAIQSMTLLSDALKARSKSINASKERAVAGVSRPRSRGAAKPKTTSAAVE